MKYGKRREREKQNCRTENTSTDAKLCDAWVNCRLTKTLFAMQMQSVAHRQLFCVNSTIALKIGSFHSRQMQRTALISSFVCHVNRSHHYRSDNMSNCSWMMLNEMTTRFSLQCVDWRMRTNAAFLLKVNAMNESRTIIISITFAWFVQLFRTCRRMGWTARAAEQCRNNRSLNSNWRAISAEAKRKTSIKCFFSFLWFPYCILRWFTDGQFRPQLQHTYRSRSFWFRCSHICQILNNFFRVFCFPGARLTRTQNRLIFTICKIKITEEKDKIW